MPIVSMMVEGMYEGQRISCDVFYWISCTAGREAGQRDLRKGSLCLKVCLTSLPRFK